MYPRFGLIVGAAMAALVALVLVFAPSTWLAEMLGVARDATTSFLLRRYAVSAIAALFVVCATAARGVTSQKSALLGLATWFAAQATVAIFGVATGTVGRFAWVAVAADPLLSGWFFHLATKSGARLS